MKDHSGMSRFVKEMMRLPIIIVVLCIGCGEVCSGAGIWEQGAVNYRIRVEIDYEKSAFTAMQTVSITNDTRSEVGEVIFNLYPNFGLGDEDEPWLKILGVRSGERDLRYEMGSRHAVLRVELPNRVVPGGVIEISIEFQGRVPGIQREESSLLAHFLQEISDAVSEEKHLRDARDIFFAGEDAWLLGYFHPLISVRQFQSQDNEFVSGVGGIVLADVADYEVSVVCSKGLTVISSGSLVEKRQMPKLKADVDEKIEYVFRGSKLRGFSISLGEKIKSLEKMAGNVRVVSWFREGDERLGEKALRIVTDALAAYEKAFGPYPYPILQVVELPLPAGFSGVDLPAMIAIAQAYYIDFDNPKTARLPGVLLEQADVIKSAFEFNLAYCVAHQFWGSIVANDSERSPYLDEALSAYSSAYYHEAVYGRQLGDLIVDQQLKGSYQAFRMLGGTDMEVEKPIKEFRNTLQYNAIVAAKGALLFAVLRKEMGDERFFSALKYYYSAHKYRIVSPEHLRYAFLAVAEDTRQVRGLFQRWLREKRGDEDIDQPSLTLIPQPVSKIRTLGRIFIRIGKTAAKPFDKD